jgi:protein AIR1/2
VRCVRCAQPGHVATYCSLPLCFGCEFKTEHLEKRCPYKSRKCSRCHERGHDVEACPHKLKRITAEQKCELCSTLGHGETDCELLWRTSGRPWEKDLPIFTVRLFCYECGQAGHLGNDCPTRQPGKPFGSSTWSAKASAGPPISTRPRPGFEIKGTAVAPQRGGPMMNNTSRGISIKGRADAHRPSPALDDDDSPTNFHRPRIPAPARPSQIHVSLSSRPSTFTTTANIATTNGRADDSYGRRRSRSRSPPRTHERSDYQASRYNGTGQEGIGYRDQGRGSVGRYEPYGTRYEEARRAPVSYEVETRRRGGGARYRPMPSAARGAWGKYRS